MDYEVLKFVYELRFIEYLLKSRRFTIKMSTFVLVNGYTLLYII